MWAAWRERERACVASGREAEEQADASFQTAGGESRWRRVGLTEHQSSVVWMRISTPAWIRLRSLLIIGVTTHHQAGHRPSPNSVAQVTYVNYRWLVELLCKEEGCSPRNIERVDKHTSITKHDQALGVFESVWKSSYCYREFLIIVCMCQLLIINNSKDRKVWRYENEDLLFSNNLTCQMVCYTQSVGGESFGKGQALQKMGWRTNCLSRATQTVCKSNSNQRVKSCFPLRKAFSVVLWPSFD